MEWGRCICKSCITVQAAGERSAEEDVFCICTGVTLITQQIHFKYKTNFQLNSNKSPTYLGFAPNQISLPLKLKHCCLCLWGAINACSQLQCTERVQSIAVKQINRQLKRNGEKIFVSFCGRQMQICYMSSTGAIDNAVRLNASYVPIGANIKF